MSPESLLSPVENKLLLGLFLMVCCVFYTHFAKNVIENYNHNVDSQQLTKENLANYSRTSMFCGYEAPTPISVQIFWLQFFTNPFLYFILRKPKFSQFLASTFVNSIMTFSILAWNLRNYEDYLFGMPWLHDKSQGYLGILTNQTAFILAVLSVVLLILQLSIIARFAIEKFQAKLYLR